MQRLAALLGAAGVAALALPSPAFAHVAGIEYRFPLPVWMYALAGAAAVVASVPAAAVAVRHDRAWTSRNLYPALARLRLGSIGVLLASVLLAVALLAGFANDELGFFNAAIVLFWVDFWVGVGIASALLGNGWDFVSEETVGRYAPSLIPIAAVYFIAHYFLYLFYVGQLTPGVVLDPLGTEWLGDYQPWTGVPGAVVWTLQAGAIVWGHIVAVVAAHRISLRANGRARAALVSQLPLVTLMVAYTFTGLLVLGLALRGEG